MQSSQVGGDFRADAAMGRYVGGDASAFNELYGAMRPRLYAFALRKTRDVARAEDLVQQTMLCAHAARGEFIPGSRVAPWLFTILLRLFLNQRRKEKWEQCAEDEQLERAGASVDVCAEVLLGAQEHRALVRRQIAILPESQRVVCRLVYDENMSYAEAAAVLGVSVASVKLRVHRANRKLLELTRRARRYESEGRV